MICKQEQISAIIVAGGQGTRFQSKMPKQFTLVNGLPVLFHTLAPFVKHPQITEIVVVLPEEDLKFIDQLCEHFPNQKINVIAGGTNRQSSVLNGLQAISCADQVLIHDGARPLVSTHLIGRTLDALKNGATTVCPVIPVTDSIVCIADDKVTSYINRSIHFRVQTPQGFNFQTILEAHKMASREELSFTDDCSIALHYGHEIINIEGDLENIKLSTPTDLLVIQSILNSKLDLK